MIEVRYTPSEVRMAAEKPNTIEGHGALYNVVSVPELGFDERIMAGAFEKADISDAVSYTHLTLPTIHVECRSRW